MTSNTKYAYVVQVTKDGIIGVFSSRARAERSACQYVKRVCDKHGVKVEVRVHENVVCFKPADIANALWRVNSKVTRYKLE